MEHASTSHAKAVQDVSCLSDLLLHVAMRNLRLSETAQLRGELKLPPKGHDVIDIISYSNMGTGRSTGQIEAGEEVPQIHNCAAG